MDESHSIVTVSRVTRHDTLNCRAYCPMLRARGDVAITLAGVWCGHDATDHILDWCEIHADAERLKLRAKQGASHGGKAHRGKPKASRFLYGYKAKAAK